jgi:NAD(P)-dependent dehydrogenase (short-subunit alcohol dehydrogenase family)
VTGPLVLAKHLAPRMNAGGSFVLFSGVAAAKIAVGTMGVAITNAAADTLARSLALELAPIQVNAISPAVIDTGAWDDFGEQGKADYFAAATVELNEATSEAISAVYFASERSVTTAEGPAAVAREIEEHPATPLP